MESERWRRVQELFHGVLERPPEERAGWLREAAAGEEALLREVEELLEADAEEDGDPLDGPWSELFGSLAGDLVGSAAPGPAVEGRRLGPYTLLRLLGRGGMGAVYLAEREDVGLRCALKLVRGGLAAPENLERFLFERRVLARLQHPHVARLLDAGIAEDGMPWFAMELVEGEAIDRFCDTHRLPVDDRLLLFEKVCEAVAYAHRNLIVHRDLKPGNILVSEATGPKLLDFGIAKLLEAPDDGLTGTGMRLLTPGYAAPEQVAGEPVTTATDVYALGLVLYELLCGHRAVTGRHPEPATLPRPSTAVQRAAVAGPGDRRAALEPAAIAAARSSDPVRLRRRLAGDLDTIVMRALAPEPERRYPSAADLLADLRNHRRGLPVSARPDTAGYRARTFVRRNRLAVAAGGASVLALAAFAVLMTVQQAATARERDRAEAALARAELEAAKATRVSDFLVELFDVSDPYSVNAVRTDSLPVRDFLVQRGDRVMELDDQPEVQVGALHVVGRMYLSLGLHDRARTTFSRQLELARRLGSEGDGDRVAALNNLAELQKATGEVEESERNFREALALGRRVRPGTHRDLVTSMHGLGDLLRQLGRYDEAEALLRESLAARRSIWGAGTPQEADGLNNLGLALWNRGDAGAAAPLLEEALAIHGARLPAAHPMTSAVLNNLGLVRRDQGDLPAAEAALRASVEMKRTLFGDGHWRIATGLFNLSGVLVRMGRLEEAETLTRQALAITREAFGERHEMIGNTLSLLGTIRERQGEVGEAERFYGESIAAHRSILPAEHPRIAESRLRLGRLLVIQGRASEALPLLRPASAVLDARNGPAHLRSARARAWLGAALGAVGERERAGPLLEQAVASYRSAGAIETEDGAEALRLLADHRRRPR